MDFNAELKAIKDNFSANASPVAVKTVNDAKDGIVKTFRRDLAVQEGDKLPNFRLSDANGKTVSSDELLQQGPILVTFYRGEWCPYCNLALRNLQKHLSAFEAKGVRLVAISPQLPNSSLSTVEKNELKLMVLSDVGNQYARELGIVWKQPDSMRTIFEARFEGGLKTRNGDDSMELPVPTTLLVDQDGIVRHAEIEPELTKRTDAAITLGWVDDL